MVTEDHPEHKGSWFRGLHGVERFKRDQEGIRGRLGGYGKCG